MWRAPAHVSSSGGATTMHIDTDEAQAAGNPTVGEIYR